MDNTIGDNIKKIRTKNNMKQSIFANTIGISQGTLSDIENGKGKPSVDTVLAISEKFDISTDRILKKGLIDIKEFTSHESVLALAGVLFESIEETIDKYSSEFGLSPAKAWNLVKSFGFEVSHTVEEYRELISLYTQLDTTDQKEIIEFIKIKIQSDRYTNRFSL
jgi:transcriptional regulator with XRE-family HTH domain